jgi:excisionase family DNA binding protein
VALVTVSEVARRLAVSEKTVRRWIDRGDLVAHQLGRAIRISEADLRAFVALRRGA